MTVSKQKPYVTREEYLERERRAETKSEYHDGVIVAMSGASKSHDRIVVSTLGSLNNQLQNMPCEPCSSDTRVYIPAYNRCFYPDVLVSCPDALFEDSEGDTLLNPTVIFEVLSDSTERADRRLKADCCRSLPSLAACILIAQDEPRMEVFVPDADSGWRVEVVKGLDGEVTLPVIDCRLRLADVYARVRFPLALDADALAAQNISDAALPPAPTKQ